MGADDIDVLVNSVVSITNVVKDVVEVDVIVVVSSKKVFNGKIKLT